MINETKQIGHYESVNKICAGIDVHRDFVCVTMMKETAKKGILTDYREFESNTASLNEMRDWLVSHGCKVAGLESTGKYWFPVNYALEDAMKVKVYNARHMRNIPGKKTDKKDSEWIAKITRHGLLRSSYIPEQQIRDARLMARERKALVQERGSVRQRASSVLDSAGIKISSVITDVFGTSGRKLLALLISGVTITPELIKANVHVTMHNKVDKLMLAMTGYMRDTHRYLLKNQVEHEQYLSKQIEEIETKLRGFLIDDESKEELVERIITIPGFADRSSVLLLAETGLNLDAFPTSQQFCSWLGLAPGKKESAGKNMSGRIQVRQRYSRALFAEVALSASRCKGTYVRTKYLQLKSSIGGKKAIIAIAHYLAKAVYRAIKDKLPFKELTENYASLRQTERDIKQLARISKRLGSEAVLALVSNNVAPTL